MRRASLTICVLTALAPGCAKDSRELDAGLGSSDSGVLGEDGAVSRHCKEWSEERLPFFGDLHVHTALSLDANLQGTRLRPRDAYRFARGERVDLPPYDANGEPLRTLQLERPLDFVAVSDHAEFLGLRQHLRHPGLRGLRLARVQLLPRRAGHRLLHAQQQAGSPAGRRALSGALRRGQRAAAAVRHWLAGTRSASAAEQANDSSAECSFTAFVAYEWSGSPDTKNLHRNVIFRGSKVPRLPFSYFDGSYPEQLWQSLDATSACQAPTATC